MLRSWSVSGLADPAKKLANRFVDRRKMFRICSAAETRDAASSHMPDYLGRHRKSGLEVDRVAALKSIRLPAAEGAVVDRISHMLELRSILAGARARSVAMPG